jgi:hypothetical protein
VSRWIILREIPMDPVRISSTVRPASSAATACSAQRRGAPPAAPFGVLSLILSLVACPSARGILALCVPPADDADGARPSTPTRRIAPPLLRPRPLIIVAVMHHRRGPGYWLDRVMGT